MQLKNAIKRRTALGGMATTAVAILKISFAKVVQTEVPVSFFTGDDPAKVPGTPPGETGTRSHFEKLIKKPSDISSRSPLQDFHGIITPSDLHFERHHNGVPAIDPTAHKLLIHGKIRQFSFDMDARSVITFPAFPATVERGCIEIKGLVWSGRGKVHKVEISTNGGKTWAMAQLQEPVLDKAHVRFRYLWQWNGTETEISSRVTDDTGYTQPTIQQLLAARGPDMGGYHLNPVTSWVLKPDGRVLHKPESWR